MLASDANSHLAIWSNIGTGWQMTFNWPGEANDLYQGGLKGFPDGPLVVYGGFPCGIQFVDGRGAECSAAANFGRRRQPLLRRPAATPLMVR